MPFALSSNRSSISSAPSGHNKKSTLTPPVAGLRCTTGLSSLPALVLTTGSGNWRSLDSGGPLKSTA